MGVVGPGALFLAPPGATCVVGVSSRVSQLAQTADRNEVSTGHSQHDGDRAAHVTGPLP